MKIPLRDRIHKFQLRQCAWAAVPFFLALILTACETPKVVELREDPVSGRWLMRVDGPQNRPQSESQFRLILDHFDGKLVGLVVSLSHDTSLTTDVYGRLTGNTFSLKQYVRPMRDRGGMFVGEYTGSVDSNGNYMEGEVEVEGKVRHWSARRL